jgi:hypothetical protein
MDWNSIMPFIGFGGIVVICSLCFKVGRFYETVFMLKDRVFTNEHKSISSTNELDSNVREILTKLNTSEVNQKSMDSKLDKIQNTLENHEIRLSTIEKEMPKRKEDK